MIPNGPIYTSLRTSLLDFYPQGVSAKAGSNVNCGEWLSTGSFYVNSISSSSIIIETDMIDFSSMWLTEVENLINHCFEHLGILINSDSDSRSESDAWQLVTMYYYGFFAGQALLRLTGCPQVYLSKERTNIFAKLCKNTSKPNAGTYTIKKINEVSATKAEYEFKLLGKKNHEALWTSLFNYIEKEFKRIENPREDEALLYRMFISNDAKKEFNSHEWPSLIRNQVNYVPGFAYQLLLKKNITKAKGLTKKWKDYSSTDLNKALKSIKIGPTNYHEHVSFMSFVLNIIFLLMRKLYEELYARRNLDKRWELYRSTFCKSLVSNGNYGLLLKTFIKER